jgi:N-methylhydantoinase A
VTDANVVLGYLDARAFMGGRRPLDVAAAEAAIDRLAEALKISRIQAAAGVVRLINLKMADGIRLMTVRRGVDPRRYALLSFGGAAGLHAVELARALDIARIIVPTTASVLSAWGMLTTNLRYEVSRTHFETGSRSTADEVRKIFAELETHAVQRLRGWFDGPVTVERSAEMRYGEQIFEIDVPLDGIELDQPPLIKDIEARFHARHEELYTYASRDQEVVFVNARVAAIGQVEAPEAEARGIAAVRAAPPRARRKIFLDTWREVDVYALDDLWPGDKLAGPAIIEAETTTVLINAGDALVVNGQGWLDIRVAKAASI